MDRNYRSFERRGHGYGSPPDRGSFKRKFGNFSDRTHGDYQLEEEDLPMKRKRSESSFNSSKFNNESHNLERNQRSQESYEDEFHSNSGNDFTTNRIHTCFKRPYAQRGHGKFGSHNDTERGRGSFRRPFDLQRGRGNFTRNSDSERGHDDFGRPNDSERGRTSFRRPFNSQRGRVNFARSYDLERGHGSFRRPCDSKRGRGNFKRGSNVYRGRGNLQQNPWKEKDDHIENSDQFVCNGNTCEEKRKQVRPVTSLPSVYNFSWNVFHEESYIDKISCLKKDTTSLEDTVNTLKQWVDESFNSENRDFLEYTQEKFIPQDKELFHIHFIPMKTGPQYSSYIDIIEKLLMVSYDINQERNDAIAASGQFQAQQQKLLLIALLGQATLSTSTYKEAGSQTERNSVYKRVYLIGDSRIHNLYRVDVWENVPTSRPHLLCKDDLSFFSLMDFITQAIPTTQAAKGRMLLVCSVGLRDVVRHINEFGVLVTLELTLTDMKKCRQQFKETYGNEHDLLFTDILPADIVSLLESHKNAVHFEEDEQKIKEFFNLTTVKLIKFCYLLAKNMMVEDLSRIRYLSTWDIFMNPPLLEMVNSQVQLPTLADGLNPNFQKFPSIAKRICQTLSDYNFPRKPPDINKTRREVFFVCNEKYSPIEKFWPVPLKQEKPTFIFLPNVRCEILRHCLEDKFPIPGSSILVVWLDIEEMFVSTVLNDCEKHMPLKLEIPSFEPPTRIFDQLTLHRKELEKASGTANVIFTTLCPLDFMKVTQDSFNYHKILNHDMESPPENILSVISDYHMDVVDRVNMYINQSNRLRGLPSWDLCSSLYTRNRKGSLALQPALSPSSPEPVNPQTVAKIMMNVSQYSQETIKALNWMSYHYRSGPSFYENIAKPIPKKYYPRDVRDDYLASSMKISDHSHNDPSLDVAPTNELSQFFLDQSALYTPPSQHNPLNEYPYTSAAQHHPSSHHSQRPYNQQYQEYAQYYPQEANNGGGASQPGPPPLGSRLVPSPLCKRPTLPLSSEPSSAAYVPKYPHDFYKPAEKSLSAMTSATQVLKNLPANDRKKISFGIKSKTDEKLLLAPAGSGDEKEQSPAQNDDLPSLEMLETIITSLRVAHETEVAVLRKHPESHSKYAQQHAEFVEQALDDYRENSDIPDMKSIERVWELCWKGQLEKSFAKTWEKRVNHLLTMIGKGKELPLAVRVELGNLTKLEPVEEPSTETLSRLETNLLNKFKKVKSGSALSKEALERSSGVILGERMLGQVQKGWKSIGCKKSQAMLDNALQKITEFMSQKSVVGAERSLYINLSNKLNSFKDFLIIKQDNPYDLEYKSIAEITQSFSTSEMAEYVAGVIQNKGVQNAAPDDIAVICMAISAQQNKSSFSTGFVKGNTINPY